MPPKNDIDINFDQENNAYYIIWEPLIVSMGATMHEVLEELRQAAHFSVDTLIDLKLKDISN
jgi:orotidine-5'-phosphate decarboxylase